MNGKLSRELNLIIKFSPQKREGDNKTKQKYVRILTIYAIYNIKELIKSIKNLIED